MKTIKQIISDADPRLKGVLQCDVSFIAGTFFAGGGRRAKRKVDVAWSQQYSCGHITVFAGK